MDPRTPDRVLYECIERFPGIHLRDAARRTGLTLGTTHEHLAALERRALVEARLDGRYKRYFLPSAMGARERVMLMAFRTTRTRDVLERLLRDQAATQRELAAAIGVTRSVVARALHSLVDRGIVACEREGREKRYRLIDPRAAADVRRRFDGSLHADAGGLDGDGARGPGRA